MTFEKFLQDSGCGGYPLRTMLDNLEDEQIVESINDFAKIIAKEAVKKKKEYILRISKKYRRFESGVDNTGFIYISQLEAICK